MRCSGSRGLHKDSSSGYRIPSSLQRLTHALKVLTLKSTWQSMYRKSGSCIRSVLCIGVKYIMASAVMLYWSKVHRVLSSHMFFAGHHMAWSDQSMAMSETRKCPYLALLKRKWGPKIRIKSVVKKEALLLKFAKENLFPWMATGQKTRL